MGTAQDKPSSRSAPPARSWPIFRSLAAYRFSFLPQDLIAGLTLAAVAIPEQMATARLAGLPPEIGFFAFLAGSLAFAMFGQNRLLSCGADSTIAPIFAGGLVLLAATGSADYATLAAGLALMVGILLVAGGFFRLGWIADLLSVPVTTGFLAGIAVHILVSQLPSLLGLPQQNASPVHSALSLAGRLGNTNPFTVSIGLGVLAIILLSERVTARIPGALIGLVLATLAVMALHLEARGVAVIGGIAGHWPRLAISTLPVDRLAFLLPLSFLVALVIMIQTAATTRAFPSDPDVPPDVDRDFIGVGAGSLLAGLFGAFPVNASPPRTAIVAETGGRTQLTGLVAAALVIALLFFGAQLLRHVPNAALSGVLLFVALHLIRIRQMAEIYRQSSAEFLLVVATLAALVFMPIEEGVAIGIVLSLLHGIWSITRAHTVIFERMPGTSIWWPPTPQTRGETLPHVVVVAFQAPLSFLNAYPFRRDVLAILHDAAVPVGLIVLEASAVLEIDFTAAQMLNALIRQCRERDIIFAIARLESLRAQDAVRRFGIDAALGPDRLFHSVQEAVQALAPQIGVTVGDSTAAPK
ncbi:MAG: SulP family inorganic anion transporter [Methylovirgula sp.]